jgi:hypothetical protein
LRALIARLASLGQDVEDDERVEQLGLLEALKAAAAAAQARVAVAFEISQRAAQREAGVPAQRVGRGVAEQIALARRDSPSRGSRHLGLARALVCEMPHTLAALTWGQIGEWEATLIVKATAVLDAEHRAEVDVRLAGRLGPMGPRQIDAATKALAYALDPVAIRRARGRADSERRVTIRPAPDVMAMVTGLLPVAQGVAVWKALDEHARTIQGDGDERSLDQIKADTFVERLTGQAVAAHVPVSVTLVMTDTALLAGGNEPAVLEGHGPVPAVLARDLLAGLPKAEALKLRRLFTDPADGRIVGMDSTQRCFTGALRELITTRDQLCRTPWCGAPIRDVDHIQPYAGSGRTALANGQGLCRRCNHAKQAPGWRSELVPGARHTVATTTPTGHRYISTAPPLPGRQSVLAGAPPPGPSG